MSQGPISSKSRNGSTSSRRLVGNARRTVTPPPSVVRRAGTTSATFRWFTLSAFIVILMSRHMEKIQPAGNSSGTHLWLVLWKAYEAVRAYALRDIDSLG